jgi:methionine sulfoxide reductase heme-binding subunit
VPAMPLYAAFLIPLIAVMTLRLVAMAARPRGQTAEAS